MSSRDQSFNDRASAFWGHHRLGVEQLACIPSQCEFSLELRDALVGRGQLVGGDTGDPFDDTDVDQRLALPSKQGGLTDARLGRERSHRFA
jgi:hypothetical protein